MIRYIGICIDVYCMEDFLAYIVDFIEVFILLHICSTLIKSLTT